jgi:two-component system, NarL family, sensor histidine kinase UhpB
MYFLFLTAIVFSTLYSGVRLGIIAAVVSISICTFFLYLPLSATGATGGWLVLLTFAAAAKLTILLCYAQLRAEHARKDAEDKYRVIFEDAITGIYETTLEGRYVTANPKLAAILGYDNPAELIQATTDLNAQFYVQPGRREEFIQLVLKKGSVAGFESEIYRKDKEKICILENAVAVRNSSGKLIGFQGTTIDITARKRAENALRKAHEELEEKVAERTRELAETNEILRQSEEKFRTIVEVVSDCVWEANTKGVYTFISPQVKNVSGYEPDEIIGKTPYTFMTAEEARRVINYLKPIVAARQNFVFMESVTFHRTGGKIITETSGIPVFDDKGEYCGYRGVVRNITERKRIEKKLLTSQQQLRDLSAHLQFVREEERKYIARELHDELGQTLTALKIDLVRLGELVKNKLRQSSAVNIAASIAAMLKIIDMAMETTRKIVSELRPGVLDELGLAAAVEWQVNEFQKRTGIKCRIAVDFDEVNGYQNLKITIFRILQECLTNIARHSGARSAQVILKDEPAGIYFEVSDDGRGIKEEEINNSHSFGILGMRERALLLGGTIDIKRGEKGGTSIIAKIPHPSPKFQRLGAKGGD